MANDGPSSGVYHKLGSSGASHGGLGGRGACDNFKACTLPRKIPHGDLYQPNNFGCGGAQSGIGGGVMKIDVTDILRVDGHVMANSESVNGDLNSGGSGGSVIINCRALIGSLTGI